MGFSFAIKFLNFKTLWNSCDRNVGLVWFMEYVFDLLENGIVIIGNREDWNEIVIPCSLVW